MSEPTNPAAYRDVLTALETKSQTEYDRLVVALSGGALGISRKAVTQVDEKKINTERVGGNYDRVLVWLNAIGGIMFILGTSFAGVFFLCNLE